jgi:hypothetical protein
MKLEIRSYKPRNYHKVITVWNYITKDSIFIKLVGSKNKPILTNHNYVGVWKVKNNLTHFKAF